jgi:hypothetical protein
MKVGNDDLDEAIKRIGLTPDGEMLYLWLQRILTGVVHATDSGALQVEHGKRSLATELMHALSAGIDETYAGTRHDRCVYFERTAAADRDPAGWIARRRARLFGAGVDAREPGDAGNPGPGDAA